MTGTIGRRISLIASALAATAMFGMSVVEVSAPNPERPAGTTSTTSGAQSGNETVMVGRIVREIARGLRFGLRWQEYGCRDSRD
jgi:hypothetical protein